MVVEIPDMPQMPDAPAIPEAPQINHSGLTRGASIGDREVLYMYAIAAVAFLFFSVDVSQRDPLYWMIKYTRFFVFFTLPHITIINTFSNIKPI